MAGDSYLTFGNYDEAGIFVMTCSMDIPKSQREHAGWMSTLDG